MTTIRDPPEKVSRKPSSRWRGGWLACPRHQNMAGRACPDDLSQTVTEFQSSANMVFFDVWRPDDGARRRR